MHKEVIKNSYIVSRSYNGKKLTLEDLVSYKLFPKHFIKAGDRKIYLSDKFKVSNNQVTRIIAYVKDENGKYMVSSFFQSKSQGLYRLLRAYKYRIDDNGDEQPTWNDKGYGEESINLPFELQHFISTEIKDTINIPEKMEGIRLFYGTAMESGTDTLYNKEVSKSPIRLNGNIYSPVNKLLAPENVSLLGDDKPDFSALLKQWDIETDLYGITRARVFSSYNKKYIYLFLTDSRRRSWVGWVDNTSKVTVLGIREKWVDVGCLSTPAFEYQYDRQEDGSYKIDETFGYGNRDLIYDDTYVDMYKNYLSKIPLIKEYTSLFVKKKGSSNK